MVKIQSSFFLEKILCFKFITQLKDCSMLDIKPLDIIPAFVFFKDFLYGKFPDS